MPHLVSGFTIIFDVIMTDEVEANHLPEILWRDEGMDTDTKLVTGMAMVTGLHKVYFGW